MKKNTQNNMTPQGVHNGAIIEISHRPAYKATVYVAWLEESMQKAALWSNDDSPNAFLKELEIGSPVRFLCEHVERTTEKGRTTKAAFTPLPAAPTK
tara:strand:- start:418 stop:708 length:291 start_codon:yes stop_codon:yes gene_type:complete